MTQRGHWTGIARMKRMHLAAAFTRLAEHTAFSVGDVPPPNARTMVSFLVVDSVVRAMVPAFSVFAFSLEFVRWTAHKCTAC